jgi:uncharacterized pyridoxamine 5'-phosphate oxidase family protein
MIQGRIRIKKTYFMLNNGKTLWRKIKQIENQIESAMEIAISHAWLRKASMRK